MNHMLTARLTVCPLAHWLIRNRNGLTILTQGRIWTCLVLKKKTSTGHIYNYHFDQFSSVLILPRQVDKP